VPSSSGMGVSFLDRTAGDSRAPVTSARQDERPGVVGEAPVLCAACRAVVTDRRNAISVSGAHEHTFVNPAGIIYPVRCYGDAPGCRGAGELTAEFSWFAGYAWRYALCGSCAEHLGWVYRAEAGGAFYGLIADKLAEGRPS
jgi:hypothetical protein